MKRINTKRVMLISQRYLPNKGGIENSIRHMSESFLELGVDVDIVTSTVNTENDDKLSLYEEPKKGLRIFRYKYFNLIISFFNLTRLLKSLRRYKYEAIISRSHITTFCLLKVFPTANIVYLVPGLVNQQNSIEVRQLLGLKRARGQLSLFFHSWIQRSVCRSAKIACFSSLMEKDIIEMVDANADLNKEFAILRVTPGIDCKRFSFYSGRSTDNLAERAGHICLLCVSRLVVAKGIHYAIKSLSYLPENYTLKIVGDGPIKPELLELTKSLNLESRVMFMGASDSPEEYFNAADFFCFTSTYEPFGQTILEAMACGLPVIAFKPGQVDTVVDELVPSRYLELSREVSAEHYSYAIRKMVSRRFQESDLRELSEYAHENFSWTKLARMLINADIEY